MYIMLFLNKIKYSEITPILLFFLFISVILGIYMYSQENLSLIQTIYFLAATSTTVGYGDMSPKTNIGMIFVTFYMFLGIGMMGLIIGKIAEKVILISENRKRGKRKMNSKIDLLIIGYPSESKVKNIIKQVKKEKENFSILLINNELNEIPEWFKEFKNLYFIKGLASSVIAEKKISIDSVQTAVLLASENEYSDSINAANLSIIETFNHKVHTIVEKAYDNNFVFQFANCDLIIPITTAEVIGQEILHPGAIDLASAIFDNNTKGSQYNFNYNGPAITWKELVINHLDDDYILEGYKDPFFKGFNLFPKGKDVIQSGFVIKYRK